MLWLTKGGQLHAAGKEKRSSLNVRRGDIMAATRDVVKYWSACPDKLFDPHDGLTAFVARTTKFLWSRAIKK